MSIFSAFLIRYPAVHYYTADTVGISQLVKIRYEADALVTATIYDADSNIVAQASSEGISGFDENDFIFDSFADVEEDGERTEASIYMPNSGYKIVFTHTEAVGYISLQLLICQRICREIP